MCAVHGRADRSSRRDLPRKCSDIHAWSCSPTVRARADAPASMCRPCTLCTRTPLAQDGRQVHTCRAESALDGNSGFDHAVMMSVQTKSRGQCGMRAPLHRCTALPPGSAHAAKGKICLSVKISRRENISFLPDPFSLPGLSGSRQSRHGVAASRYNPWPGAHHACADGVIGRERAHRCGASTLCRLGGEEPTTPPGGRRLGRAEAQASERTAWRQPTDGAARGA